MKEIYRSPKFKLEGYWAHKVKYEDGTRATVLVHREMMEKHLGIRLDSNQVVHHVNENKTDNRVENFEVKTRGDHSRDHRPPTEFVEIECISCRRRVLKPARQVLHSQGKQGKPGPFCGRSCSGRFNASRREYNPPT